MWQAAHFIISRATTAEGPHSWYRVGAQKLERIIMSLLTPYSPGFPILQPGGGVRARRVEKGSLMSTLKVQQCQRRYYGFHGNVSASLKPVMATLAFLEHYALESGLGALCVVAGGSWESPHVSW